jgi:hypothetical protein
VELPRKYIKDTWIENKRQKLSKPKIEKKGRQGLSNNRKEFLRKKRIQDFNGDEREFEKWYEQNTKISH